MISGFVNLRAIGGSPGSLAMVPFAVDLGHWMDVVRHRVRVDDLKRLAHLDPHHARAKPAAALIDGDRSRRNFEALPFQARS